ncbi:MAG: Arylsulfatase [candidate division BRC1 bacterium ADurb.BinA364]|nr:MAG: Arylsulfatase [candidate division BRC1 bacterium ADurb.BinA364]
MGFEFWRAYNMHMVYFNGFINSTTRDFDFEKWEGYETEALNRYAFQFIDQCGDEPFALFLSPHQPHGTPFDYAPERYYARLPERLELPPNVPERMRGLKGERQNPWSSYRNYLAMTLALDDMLGELLDRLEARGKAANTIVVFTSDHGTQGGSQGIPFWTKKRPYEESLRVPCVARWPGFLEGGARRDFLHAPVDFFPTLCGLCGTPIPRTVEGRDLSAAWLGRPGAGEQESVFCMNFGSQHDWYDDGDEWRGVRTKTRQFTRWLDGREELFDLANDPLQTRNLAGEPAWREEQAALERMLAEHQARRGDTLAPCSSYRAWVDSQRRPIRNAFGPLSDPEGEPDWSLLYPA